MFIPAEPNNASFLLLNNLTVEAFTDLTKYGAPSDKVPEIRLAGS